ncbi:MAG: hypothetical protein Q4C84_14180 [Bacillota bacterium]|nr:hypothetical protein [Bacillota bacterium]
MKKLFCIEVKRSIRSPLLWTAAGILILLNIFGMVLNSYGFTITASTFLFYNTPVICIFLSLFIPLHIGQEFEVRTINNKILSGYSRTQIYIAEMLISILWGWGLFLIDIGSILLLSKIVKLPLGIALSELFIECIMSLICITTIAALFTTITMLLHKRLNSIAVTLCVALIGLYLGGNTVSDLKQEAFHIEKDGSKVENTLHLEGLERILANAHLMLSPFTQVKYQPDIRYETNDMKIENSLVLKNAFHHWEFPITNFIEIVIFTQIGVMIFKKQDLK